MHKFKKYLNRFKKNCSRTFNTNTIFCYNRVIRAYGWSWRSQQSAFRRKRSLCLACVLCATKWAVYQFSCSHSFWLTLLSLSPWAINARRQKASVLSLPGATDDRAGKKGAGTQNFQPNYLAERLATVGNEAKKAKHALRERENERAMERRPGAGPLIYTHTHTQRQVRCRACHAALAQQTLMQNKPPLATRPPPASMASISRSKAAFNLVLRAVQINWARTNSNLDFFLLLAEIFSPKAKIVCGIWWLFSNFSNSTD